MNLNWIQLGSFMMFLGVILGAFGAHAIKDKVTEYSLEIYKTGVLYHFLHALALFIVAWLSTISADPKIQLAGIFFIIGIVLFSGSLYVLALSGIKILGAITPLGGLSFLIGWILLILAKYKGLS